MSTSSIPLGKIDQSYDNVKLHMAKSILYFPFSASPRGGYENIFNQ
jgi:hypothetical protein